MATKHLSALEVRLGAQLLHRTTRRVVPTEIGRNYVKAAERILADFQEAEGAAAADKLVIRGLLRVNAPVSFGISEVAPLLNDLSTLYPALSIELGLNDRVVDLVEEGWDLAIRIGKLQDSPMIARRLAPFEMAVCAAPVYLKKHGRPTKVADLKNYSCLGYTLSHVAGFSSWRFGSNGDISVQISGPLRAGNGDALVAAAVEGMGLIYQPTFIVANSVADSKLEIIELDHPPFNFGSIYAVYPPNEHLPAKVRVFIDFLVERFAGAPPWQRRIEGRKRRR